MEKLNGINIDYKDLKNIRKLGEGRDAIIYSAPNGLAFKMYKNPEEDRFIDAIQKIQRNKYDVKLSDLPLGAIYINDEFKGVLLKRIHGFQIHKVFGLLSRKSQIAILKRIVAATKELTDNYIYPADLANTPFLPGKSSNILLDYKKIPHLIDIDGSGAFYAGREYAEGQEVTNMGLSMLFLDLIFGEPVLNEPELRDVDYLCYRLNKLGFNKYLSQKLSHYEANYSQIEDAIDTYEKIKVL